MYVCRKKHFDAPMRWGLDKCINVCFALDRDIQQGGRDASRRRDQYHPASDAELSDVPHGEQSALQKAAMVQ